MNLVDHATLYWINAIPARPQSLALINPVAVLVLASSNKRDDLSGQL